MAYEHRIYVVKPSRDSIGDCGKYWASVIAVFNLGYTPGLLDFVKRYRTSRYFIYGEDEREITEDPYGDDLTEVSLTEFIDNIESIEESRRSRYVTAMLAALRVFKECTCDLVVLHYGY